ncbi:MAG: hypothetical protein KatS3mg003_0463 [Candidatus Nitrosocaldaceae archaeon]|nr:MAG: hypothetical protein KatS3mg003_0463 [Candidatus Nitrosocaldaceae archaeon]
MTSTLSIMIILFDTFLQNELYDLIDNILYLAIAIFLGIGLWLIRQLRLFNVINLIRRRIILGIILIISEIGIIYYVIITIQ